MENKKQKFELGELQKAWIADLRAFPERQNSDDGILAIKTNDGYSACCLGQLHITALKLKGKEPVFNDEDKLYDGELSDECYLEKSWKSYGLKDEKGTIVEGRLSGRTSLSSANDKGCPWPEIADFIEANPEKVFTKSV